MVAARFQTGVEGRAPGAATARQCGDLGVRPAEHLVAALTQHLFVPCDDRAHHRVGMDAAPTVAAQLDRARQVATVRLAQSALADRHLERGDQSVIRNAADRYQFRPEGS